jgi:hypothetical protein
MSIIDQIIISKNRIRECEQEVSELELVIQRYENNLELKQIFQDSKDELEIEIAENKKFLRENGECFP